jgi:hypothetical protein
MVQIRLIALAAVALVASGCGGNMNKYLRKQAGKDLSCSESQVHLSTITKAGAQYLAEACGRRAVYTYSREQGAVRISAIEGASTTGEPVVMPPPGVAGSDVPPPPPPPPPPPRP